MKKLLLVLTITMFLVSLGSSLGTAQAANPVKKVQVKIQILGNASSSELKNRINNSVQKVSEKVLLGQDVTKVKQNREYLEYTIQEVFNRVLAGYQVKKVRLEPATQTLVQLELLPLGQKVEGVTLIINPHNFSPPLTQLLEEQKPKLEKAANKALQGLPVETSEWSEAALEPLLERMIAKQLPGFQAGIDFQWGKNTKVVLDLEPVAPLIRHVEVELSSQSLPKVLLEKWRKKAEEQAEIFQGLPVAFVQTHLTELENALQKELGSSPAIKDYGLVLTPLVQLGEVTKVEINVESSKYVVGLQGSLSLGSEAPHEAELRLHLGKYIHSRQEIFVEPVFYPNPVKLEWNGGYAYQINPKNQLGLSYNFTKEEQHFYLNHNLDRGKIKIDHNFHDSVNEFTYRYPFDEYCSVSFTSNSKGENWLALIGDF